MENQRTTPVTLDRLSKKHMIISVVVSMVFLALCIMSGLLSGPMEVQQIPATAENYDILHMDCNADYNNKAVEPPVPMCWRRKLHCTATAAWYRAITALPHAQRPLAFTSDGRSTLG